MGNKKYVMSACFPRRKGVLMVGIVDLSTTSKDTESCFPFSDHP